MNVLFWNISKRNLFTHVSRLAEQRRVDLVILAECPVAPSDAVAQLNQAGASPFAEVASSRTKIRSFFRGEASIVKEQFADLTGSVVIHQVITKGSLPVNVVGVHLPSRINWSVSAQSMHSVEVARDIRTVEADVGHSRTIAIGDFNMNPFDAGMVAAQGFNAVMTRHEAKLRGRKVQGRQYSAFFNPMWQFLTDRDDGPSGTFYLRSLPPDAQPWAAYDQVLIRPGLLNALRDVDIAHFDGERSLCSARWRPDRNRVSDHLPVFVSLDLGGKNV